MNEKMKNAASDLAYAVFPMGRLAKVLVDLAVDAVKKTDDLKTQSTPALREIAERQELEQRIEQAKAKVAQEYAIAARIQSAAEVEMEELYEYVGDGGIGVKGNINTGDVGLNLNGSVRRVSKRIYRFRGGNDGVEIKPNQIVSLDDQLVEI